MRVEFTSNDLERFWSKVAIASPTVCWNWIGACRSGKPYGQLWMGGKVRYAHRIAYAIAHGHWPAADLIVCHACDNPRCVNPNHLFLATQRENILDAAAKGLLFGRRTATYENNAMVRFPEKRRLGENNHAAKLSDENVLAMRHDFTVHGLSKTELARRYGVSRQTVLRVVARENWNHVV